MADSLEEIKARMPFLVLIQPYTSYADHTTDTFWYSRVTACDLEYHSLKFNPEYWRGTFIIGLNRRNSLVEFLSVGIIKETKLPTVSLIEALIGDLYYVTASRGNQHSYDVFLSPK